MCSGESGRRAGRREPPPELMKLSFSGLPRLGIGLTSELLEIVSKRPRELMAELMVSRGVELRSWLVVVVPSGVRVSRRRGEWKRVSVAEAIFVLSSI